MQATRLLMRLSYPRADAIVAVSKGVAQDLLKHVSLDAGRVVTIYNPVVDEHLQAQAAAAPAHPWLAPGAPPVVLAAGRLIAQKDFSTLLQAFARLRQQRPLRLLILGEGELRAPLLVQAAQLGVADDVAMPGFEANPYAAMRAAAVFVLSSRFEGLPGHVGSQHRQRLAQVDHVIQTGAKEVCAGGAIEHPKLPEINAKWALKREKLSQKILKKSIKTMSYE